MEGKAGYATTTCKLKLYGKHAEWVHLTKTLYNDVVSFYYALLASDLPLLDLGNLALQRRLEELTIAGRDKIPAPQPLPFLGIPVYFRRSAINAAIGLMRSYKGLLANWEDKKAGAQKTGRTFYKHRPGMAKTFHISPVLYQGMYKSFGGGSILLKLWTGSAWCWVRYNYAADLVDETAQVLSPTLVLCKGTVWLHLPVVSAVEDARTVKERVKAAEKCCAVTFASADAAAVCVLFDSDGHASDSYFIRGGKELASRRKRLLGTIYKNREHAATAELSQGENARYWEKLRHLNDAFAHRISRRIIDYCIQNDMKMIAVPKIRAMDGKKRFFKSNESDFIGRRIAAYLSYKAWKAGIVVTTVNLPHSVDNCNQCRTEVSIYSDRHGGSSKKVGALLYQCPNGHRGNAALNTAKNIGAVFFKKFSPRKNAG